MPLVAFAIDAADMLFANITTLRYKNREKRIEGGGERE